MKKTPNARCQVGRTNMKVLPAKRRIVRTAVKQIKSETRSELCLQERTFGRRCSYCTCCTTILPPSQFVLLALIKTASGVLLQAVCFELSFPHAHAFERPAVFVLAGWLGVSVDFSRFRVLATTESGAASPPQNRPNCKRKNHPRTAPSASARTTPEPPQYRSRTTPEPPRVQLEGLGLASSLGNST